MTQTPANADHSVPFALKNGANSGKMEKTIREIEKISRETKSVSREMKAISQEIKPAWQEMKIISQIVFGVF
jgi:uncharacterized protein (UPF0335 family)